MKTKPDSFEKDKLFNQWEQELLSLLNPDDFSLSSTTNDQNTRFVENNLATKFPEIAKEWDSAKNEPLTPFNVSYASKKKVWWRCSTGHDFLQAIDKRTLRKSGCYYCSGHKAWPGLNDFQTKFPDIAKEWHPFKNGDLKPSEVTYGSGRKVWWRCPNGHDYFTSPHERGNGHSNCPICRTRLTTSFPEQAIFYYLKKVFPDAISRYGEIFERSMELDIYIPSIKVAVEYDGAIWHRTSKQYQREKKKFSICQKHGIDLIRIKEITDNEWCDTANHIFWVPKIKRFNLADLNEVIRSIFKYLKIDSFLIPQVDVLKDKIDILSYVFQIKNSLLEKRPDIANRWHPLKNKSLKPNMFTVSSSEIVWWRCPNCNYEWEASINSLTRKGSHACPNCAKKLQGRSFTKRVVKEVGSLAKNMPELAKQWHPTKNGDLTPNDITSGKFQPVWWLCEKCGHEWKSSPNNRRKGVGCPCCSGRVPKRGVNDLATLRPDIAKEWHPSLNGELQPHMLKSKSSRKVWWLCPICNKAYATTVQHRTAERRSTACPSCGHKRGALQFSIKVEMLDPQTSMVLKVFESISEATKVAHVSHQYIRMACDGKRETAGGYKWRYFVKD